MNLTEHAAAEIVEVLHRLLKALPHLVRDNRGGNHLRVGMLPAGSSIGSVILEDSDLRDARIEAELVIARLINAEDVGDL